MVCACRHAINSVYILTLYVCTISHLYGKVPCLQSIDTAMLINQRSGMIRRSESLSIVDLDEGVNAPQSPTKSKASRFYRDWQQKEDACGKLVCWSRFSCFTNKATIHVSEVTTRLIIYCILHLRLTTGLENVLFHYVSLDWAKGIFISPAHMLAESSNLHEAMMDTFGKTCTRMQEAWQVHENEPQVCGDTSLVSQCILYSSIEFSSSYDTVVSNVFLELQTSIKGL